MKKYFLFLCLALAQLLLWSSCEEDPKCTDATNPSCPNYDPCYGKKPVSAAFKIEQEINGRVVETDTVAYSVRFTALEEADTYTWYLGTEVINEKSFSRYGFPKDAWLKVKLVVTKKVNACFPNAKEVDSLTKRFYVWPETEVTDPTGTYYMLINPFPIYGTYYGSLKSNPNLKFNATLLDTNWVNSINLPARVEIVRGIPYPPNFASDKINRNTNPGSFFDGDSPYGLTISSDEMGGGVFSPVIPAMKGFAWLEKGNPRAITIAYSFKDTLGGIWKIDTFRGNKIY